MKALWVIARHELIDSIRSRRVLVLMLLYVVGAALATLVFVNVLQKIERQLVESLGLSAPAGAGSVTATLWRSDAFKHMLTNLAGDRALAEHLLSIPPLGLFHGWLAFAFGPALVMLTASTRISEEIHIGSVRYVLYRVPRATWCLGKFVGQAGQMAVALLAGGAGAWLVGWVRMESFDAAGTAVAMLVFSAKAWVYLLAWLGLAFAVSQACGVPNLALALGFVSLLVLSVLTRVSEHFAGDGWRRAWDVAHVLTPGAHRMGLWWGDAGHMVPAAAFLLTLSAMFLLLGHLRFARRDL